MNKMSEGLKSTSNAAKQRAATAVEKSKETAARSIQSSKELAYKAVEKSGDSLDKNPLAIVAGGLVLGLIAGALLPRHKNEEKILGKAGKKLNKQARKAADAAKQAGKDKIDTLGLGSDALRSQFRDLVAKASEAVKAAGQAAAQSARSDD